MFAFADGDSHSDVFVLAIFEDFGERRFVVCNAFRECLPLATLNEPANTAMVVGVAFRIAFDFEDCLLEIEILPHGCCVDIVEPRRFRIARLRSLCELKLPFLVAYLLGNILPVAALRPLPEQIAILSLIENFTMKTYVVPISTSSKSQPSSFNPQF